MSSLSNNQTDEIMEKKRSHQRIGSFANPLKVQIKRVADSAVMPTYAHDTDAGMDLYATSKKYDEYGNMVIGTGIAVAIPKGYVGLVFPRSSISKHRCMLSNAVGVIDSGYRGEITFKFAARATFGVHKKLIHRLALLFLGAEKMDRGSFNIINSWGSEEQSYRVGDRVGQLIIMPYPNVTFDVVDELPASERGDGGYGSTGK